MLRILNFVIVTIFIVVPTHLVSAQSFWQEPNCDPSIDPAACNVAAPLNVSSSNQTKIGGLTIQGTLNATSGFTFSGAASSFSVTPDSITDSMVSNTLTASSFVRNGDYSATGAAVNLNTWTSTPSASAEVLGTLPTSAIADDWVNETGDTMTGELAINPGSNRAILITQTTTTAQHAISIGQGATTNGIGIHIDNPSSSATAYPINIRVVNATRRAINIEQGAVDGIGVYAYGTGSNTIGIYGYGNNTTGRGVVGIAGTLPGTGLPSGTAGVYGISYTNGTSGIYGSGTTSGDGVIGETSATNRSGVIGKASATGAIGVSGQSTTSTGVFGATTGTSGNYGVIGCANNTNCGKIGGVEFAGQFDNRVVGYDFLPTEEERFGTNSFRTGGKWGSVTISGIDWEYVTFMASDGEELWVNLAHPANPNMYRVNSAMMTQNTSQSHGSIGFRGATLGSKGFLTIRNTDGEICVWEKAAASFSCPGTPDPDLEYTESIWFDGSYYWAGRTGGRGITRFDDTFTFAASVQTTGATGPGSSAIVDFTQDEKNVYALEDTNTGVFPSSSKIKVIDRSGNKIDKEYNFNNLEVRALEFDGKYIWGAAVTTSGQDGLVRLDPVTGSFSFLDFSAPYPTQFDGPRDLVFDGTYLWVILENSLMMARVSPYQANLASPTVIENDFMTFSYAPHTITFDGEAIWVLVRDTSGAGTTNIVRIHSGKGYGYQTTTVFPREGISIWDNTTGTGSCIRVESGALVVNTGALCN